MIVRSRIVSSADEWQDALDDGAADGIAEGADVVRQAAEDSIAARVDPWGAAFAPLSTTTVKLYASAETEIISRAGNVRVSKRRGSAFGPLPAGMERIAESHVVSVRGSRKTQQIAYIAQFGNPNNRMFDNEKVAPIPARPALPLRRSAGGAVVDLPPATVAAVQTAVQRGLSRAFDRQSRGARNARR